mmetsp:Transcript_28667/g.57198  ORF Transcript_28667/g.57198 Transcript_28667/m.57198 type:complete len:142 (+) Transcript_28667:785-1210(+)
MFVWIQSGFGCFRTNTFENPSKNITDVMTKGIILRIIFPKADTKTAKPRKMLLSTPISIIHTKNDVTDTKVTFHVDTIPVCMKRIETRTSTICDRSIQFQKSDAQSRNVDVNPCKNSRKINQNVQPIMVKSDTKPKSLPSS